MGALILKLVVAIIGGCIGVGEVISNSIETAKTWQEVNEKRKELKNTEEESE